MSILVSVVAAVAVCVLLQVTLCANVLLVVVLKTFMSLFELY